MGKKNNSVKLGQALALAIMMDPLGEHIPWYRRQHSSKSTLKVSQSNYKAYQGPKEKARRLRQIERGLLRP
jgi:hypothetical protein